MRFLDILVLVVVCVSMLLDCAVDDPVVSVCPLMELTTPVWTAPVIYG
jgi:hypothetical protein